MQPGFMGRNAKIAVRTSSTTGSHGPGRTLSGGIRQGNLMRNEGVPFGIMFAAIIYLCAYWPSDCGLIVGGLPPNGRIYAFGIVAHITIDTSSK